MTELKKIIASGILESYCLGASTEAERKQVENYIVQFPEIATEIESIRQGIEQYANAHSIQPPSGLKTEILDKIESLRKKENKPAKLPAFKEINEHSDIAEWQSLVKGIEPPDQYEIHLHNIYSDKQNFLFVAWVNKAVPMEVHEDIHESFLILEGTCTCKVGEEFIDLKAGDYFKVPLFLEHSIKVTSSAPVKAILQRKLTA